MAGMDGVALRRDDDGADAAMAATVFDARVLAGLERLDVPPGARHRQEIDALAGRHRRALFWDLEAASDTLADLPADLPADLIVVAGAGADADAVTARLAPDGVVAILGAERPAFDALKSRLIEHGHVGRCPDAGPHHLWIGGRRPPAPATVPGRRLPLVISYYTRNTRYEALAERLRASCDRFDHLAYRIEGIDDRGSWEANCARKARFVRDVWRDSGRPVLWVDADAVLRRLPVLPDLGAGPADFAIHKVDGWEFASGTVFFNATEPAGRLLDAWTALCEARPHLWDQMLLDQAWELVVREHPLRTLWLPATYTHIFDRPLHGHRPDEVVVEHHQASRDEQASGNKRPKPVLPAGLAEARCRSRPLGGLWIDRLDRAAGAAPGPVPGRDGPDHATIAGARMTDARGRHVFICGFSRSGSTLFYNMMRSTVPDMETPPHELPAARIVGNPGSALTKRPLDVFDIDAVLAANTLGKDVHCILLVRDIRSIVTSRHVSVPGDYFIGFDHQYFVSDGVRSYTNPGALATHEAIVAALARPDLKTMLVRYEDLVRDPDAVQDAVGAFCGLRFRGRFADFHRHEIPERLTRALNGIRPVDPDTRHKWRRPEHRERIVDQFTRCPRLFDMLEYYGYETGRGWFEAFRQG